MTKAKRKKGWTQMEIDGRNGVWSIEAWCSQWGCSGPTFYKLDPPPHQVKVGGLVKISESPPAYTERVRQLQAQPEAA